MTSARHADFPPPSALDVLALRALERLTALPDVMRAGFAVSEGGRRQLLFTATDRGDDTGSFEWCHIDATAEVPLNRSVRHGELVDGDLDELEGRFPAFVRGQRGKGIGYVATVPVTDEGEYLGGFVLYFDRPQEADHRWRARLLALGQAIGTGVTRARRDQRRQPPSAGGHLAEAGTATARRATYEMPGELTAIAEARRFLRVTLESWAVPAALVDDAVLCLAELVTNAVVHTHAGCHVRAELGDGVLAVRVFDYGGLGPVRVTPTEDVTAHGRGLQIVDSIASRTGRDPAACLAWFELDLADAG